VSGLTQSGEPWEWWWSAAWKCYLRCKRRSCTNGYSPQSNGVISSFRTDGGPSKNPRVARIGGVVLS
jgi:hypothetical protein